MKQLVSARSCNLLSLYNLQPATVVVCAICVIFGFDFSRPSTSHVSVTGLKVHKTFAVSNLTFTDNRLICRGEQNSELYFFINRTAKLDTFGFQTEIIR